MESILILVIVGVFLSFCFCKAASRGNCTHCSKFTDHLYNWHDGEELCADCDEDRMNERDD